MNDSFGKISSPVPARPGQGAGRGAQIVQIIQLPDGLQNTARALRLDGQITQVNNANNTARIATPEGDVEVRFKGNRSPQVGQRLDVEIPAGRPPRQATIRASTPQQSTGQTPQSNTGVQPQPVTTTPPATTVQQPAQNTVPNTNQNIQTPPPQQAPQQTSQQAPRALPPAPVPAALQAAVTQNTNPNNIGQQSRPLAQDAVVRLLSVPPAQAQNIAAEFFQTLPQPQNATLNNLLAQVNLSANITAQNASSQQTQTLLQTILPAPQTPTNSLINNTQNLGQLIQSTPISTPPQTITTPGAITPNTTLPPVLLTPVIPNALTLPPSLTSTLIAAAGITPATTSPSTSPTPVTGTGTIPTPQTATLTPTPLVFDPANPTAQTSLRIGQIDVQVLKILPPAPLLTTALTAAPTTPQISVSPPLPAATQFTPPLISQNNAVTLTAQVTGFTPQNLPLVSVQFPNVTLPQSFILQSNTSNLQLGSQLQILPQNLSAATNTTNLNINTAAATIVRSPLLNPLLQGFQWPALDELYNGLLQVSPQAAASLSRALPNAANASQIGPAAMMFIAAVRAGDVGAWLGQNKMDALQRIGKGDILSRLTQNTTGAARAPAAEATSNAEWRAVPLPMFWEGEIHKITLYTRHENQSDQRDQPENGQTRFVFDLALSRMGDIQLDGLLRDNRLDLVIRAQNIFSTPMQQTMRQAYSTALDQTELTGELNFQGHTKNWVHVLEQKEGLGVHV